MNPDIVKQVSAAVSKVKAMPAKRYRELIRKANLTEAERVELVEVMTQLGKTGESLRKDLDALQQLAKAESERAYAADPKNQAAADDLKARMAALTEENERMNQIYMTNWAALRQQKDQIERMLSRGINDAVWEERELRSKNPHLFGDAE